MESKELIKLIALAKAVAEETGKNNIVAFNSWGVQITTKGLIDAFGTYGKEVIDSERFYLVVNIDGVRFFALTDKEEMEALNEED